MKKQNNIQQETYNTWNKVAQLYEDHFMDLDLYNETYDLFCQSIKKTNPSIFEIGCGPGNITKYLKAKQPHFEIKAIDYSEKMIALAQKNNPSIDFEVMDCKNISTLSAKFDGIICGFIIPYLSDSECAKFIRDCGSLLEKEAPLYLSFVEGDYMKSGFITGSTGDRAYFYYHDFGKLEKELEKNGLVILNRKEKQYQKSDGLMEVHTIVIARREV